MHIECAHHRGLVTPFDRPSLCSHGSVNGHAGVARLGLRMPVEPVRAHGAVELDAPNETHQPE